MLELLNQMDGFDAMGDVKVSLMFPMPPFCPSQLLKQGGGFVTICQGFNGEIVSLTDFWVQMAEGHAGGCWVVWTVKVSADLKRHMQRRQECPYCSGMRVGLGHFLLDHVLADMWTCVLLPST